MEGHVSAKEVVGLVTDSNYRALLGGLVSRPPQTEKLDWAWYTKERCDQDHSLSFVSTSQSS